MGSGTFWGPGEAREGASVMGGTPASLDMKEAERASPSTFAVMSQCIKKQRHHFVDKGSYIQSYGFSSSHVQI